MSHALHAVNQKIYWWSLNNNEKYEKRGDWVRHQTIIEYFSYSWRERNISIIPYLSVTDTFYKHHKNVIILSETSTRRIRDEMREDIKIQTSHKYILHRHHHSRAAHRVTQTKEIIKFTLLCGLEMEHTVNNSHLTPYTHINPSHPIYLFKCLI